ncbi:MAG: type III pantothenate kinase [Planctomycetota bacterium]
MPPTLIAIDIGNSRAKLGVFQRPGACVDAAQGMTLPIATPPLAEPAETLTLDPPLSPGSESAEKLADWLATCTAGDGPEGDGPTSDDADGKPGDTDGAGRPVIAIASVHRGMQADLTELLRTLGAPTPRRLTNDQLPIEVGVDQPAAVGIDRLLGCVAANRLRRDGRAAVVVDLGTAITVDLVTPDGAFAGGAILPGIAMSGWALHEQTDALPPTGLHELDAAPDAVGKSTGAAIDAGLFWGAVGAVRELIARQSDRLTAPPQVFLTGGAAPSVARLLGGPEVSVRYVPHLVLSGIAAAVPLTGPGP